MRQNMLFKFNHKPLIGDWLVIVTSLIAIIFMFQQFWSIEPASKLKIRQGNKVLGTYDLNQVRELKLLVQWVKA